MLWQPDPQKTRTVYTTVDRSVYIEVSVPAGAGPAAAAAGRRGAALPAICTGTDAAGNAAPKLPLCH